LLYTKLTRLFLEEVFIGCTALLIVGTCLIFTTYFFLRRAIGYYPLPKKFLHLRLFVSELNQHTSNESVTN